MRVLAVLLIAGCFAKPPRPDGTADDAKTSDGNSACTSPSVQDDFDEPAAMPCGAGFEDPNGLSTIVRESGELVMSIAGGTPNDASCSWTLAFDQGTFIEVREHLGPGGTFTILQLEVGDLDIGISVIDEGAPTLQMFDTIQPTDIVQLAYDSSEMKWWRLRPEGGLVIGEYSADGRTWIRLGASVSPAPSTTKVSVNAGAYLTLPDAQQAWFDHFNVCK